MEIGEKIIIALVVVVTVGVIGGAAIMMPILEHEMHKPESCGANCHEMLKAWQKAWQKIRV